MHFEPSEKTFQLKKKFDELAAQCTEAIAIGDDVAKRRLMLEKAKAHDVYTQSLRADRHAIRATLPYHIEMSALHKEYQEHLRHERASS